MFDKYNDKNKELIILNEDNKNLLIKKLNDILGATSFLKDMITKNELTEDMKKTLLSNITFNKNDVDIILDKDKDDLERTKERENHLRQANLKIRDLEDKIKDLSLGKYDEDILPNILSKLNDIVYKKWNNPETGFCGLVNMEINENVIYFTFRPMFTFLTSSSSKTPVTDKENHLKWIDSLKEKGIIFSTKEKDLIFNDFNLNYFEKIVKNIIPGCTIENVDNIVFNNEFLIKNMKVKLYFKDLINVFEN